LLAAGLAVRAVDLDHGHARSLEVAGQTGAIGTGPFDPNPFDGPETAEPAQQLGVAGGGGGERFHPQQAADAVEGGGHVDVQMGVHTAGHGARLYDGHCHPFLGLRGGTHLHDRTLDGGASAKAQPI
jgi:hypothetical protein